MVFAGVGLEDNADIEKLPEAIPKPIFSMPSVLKKRTPAVAVFDLETSSLSM